VGLDIHSKRISLCLLSETGQVVRRTHVRTIEEMMRILEGLPDRFEVCYEASCGYGHYHDLLRPLAARVLVVHSARLQFIFRSKNKNDRNDAERLPKLLSWEKLRQCTCLRPRSESGVNYYPGTQDAHCLAQGHP
jgi:hypothetical protein